MDCALCLRMYEQGDLDTLPCTACWVHIMPVVDEVTQLSHEVYNYLARSTFPQQAPPLEFIFKLVGLRLGSAKAKAVWDRILTRLEIEAEYREKRGEHASRNGDGDQAGAAG